MIAMTLASLGILLRALKLPTMARHADEVAQLAEREGWTFGRYLHHLVELEVHERRRSAAPVSAGAPGRGRN